VVVFNFPAGDTVTLENQDATYYERLLDEGRAGVERNYTIVTRPVDKRENYVKRCVGLPGDSIRIVDAQLYVNGLAQKQIAGVQQYYLITTNAPFTDMALERMGITPNSRRKDRRDMYEHVEATGEYVMPLTAANVEKMSTMGNVLDIQLIERGAVAFPRNGLGWTENNYGPLWIPARGATVQLTVDNLPLYERIIDVYEANDLRVDGNTIYINGAPATSYTFKMDYYWMLGDNRQNSADSRFWGFVPEDHIVGKASFVWLSLDKDRGLFDGKIRWSKMFRKVR
jgi:signal peptidase I